MEVRLLSVGARGFFSRHFATRHRDFATQFSRPKREKNLWTQGTAAMKEVNILREIALKCKNERLKKFIKILL